MGGSVVIAPGDVRNAVLLPERRGSACCGFDGSGGPNMGCVECGLPVASRIDDCSLWQAVWLERDAVRRVPVEGADTELASWAELLAEGVGVPPAEPIAPWGEPFRAGDRWHWSPQWTAAAGEALVPLLVASEGEAVDLGDGLVSTMFRSALDALLPAGPPTRRAVLGGPGQPGAYTDADILLVPLHPRTGEVWSPPPSRSSGAPGRLVPLPFGVWFWLVSPEPQMPVPASGALPDGVLRDEPPTPSVHDAFEVDWRVFRRALARLPVASRAPWLRGVVGDFS
ncbi:hypothetical protein [Streptomyces sp. NPDC048659]|uniref:hypothetical protein n=1 Tax=Streptomyces sp. NPDC048659 TaxID=3155489 RepID=UPI003413DDA4